MHAYTKKEFNIKWFVILLEEKPNGSHPNLRNKIKGSYKFEQTGKP